MKSLVVYYSKTGNTERIAKIIGEELKKVGEVEFFKIEEAKEKGIIFTYIFGSLNALLNKGEEIKHMPDLQKYELICIGSPVWAWSPVPAINMFIRKGNFEGKKVALFVTYRASVGKGIEEMKRALEEKGAKVIAEERFSSIPILINEEEKAHIFAKMIVEKTRREKI